MVAQGRILVCGANKRPRACSASTCVRRTHTRQARSCVSSEHPVRWRPANWTPGRSQGLVTVRECVLGTPPHGAGSPSSPATSPVVCNVSGAKASAGSQGEWDSVAPRQPPPKGPLGAQSTCKACATAPPGVWPPPAGSRVGAPASCASWPWGGRPGPALAGTIWPRSCDRKPASRCASSGPSVQAPGHSCHCVAPRDTLIEGLAEEPAMCYTIAAPAAKIGAFTSFPLLVTLRIVHRAVMTRRRAQRSA